MLSVALASFNGEKYIKKQIQSILDNLDNDDELVISDDGSTDNTLEIIKAINDSRIKLISGPRDGINKNFENAIKHCKGDYIFLSDQDDFWYPNKVSMVVECFEKNNCSIVEHDALVCDRTGKELYSSFLEKRKPRAGVAKNILKNSYHGSCMAFKTELKKYILPIPNALFYHDQWIGILSDYYYKNTIFLHEKLMNYYRYEANNSNFEGDSWEMRIKKRAQLSLFLIIRILRNHFDD